MEVKASIKNSLVTARKARLVIDTVRGKSVENALDILNFSPQKAAKIVKKLIESASANAVHNFGLEKNNLFIKFIEAQEGMVMKRWLPRAHGHATPILKKRSHIIVKLGEFKPTTEKAGKKSKMQTVSYDEVKQAIKEAEKAAKMVKGKVKGDKKAEVKGKPEKNFKKDSEKATRLGNIGDTFKNIVRKQAK